MTSYDDIMQRLDTVLPDALRKNSKFAVKLDFASRCAVVAASKAGVNNRLIAAAFGITRPTISMMTRPSSKNYRDVRKEYNDLGHQRFIEQYLTAPIIERLEAAKKDPEIKLSIDDLREVRADASNLVNTKADKLAGVHRITYYEGTIEAEIKLVEAGEPSVVDTTVEKGWFVRVLPTQIAGWTDAWMGDTVDQNQPFRTSKLALDAFLSAIGGTLE